jgi:hypothetical protein
MADAEAEQKRALLHFLHYQRDSAPRTRLT